MDHAPHMEPQKPMQALRYGLAPTTHKTEQNLVQSNTTAELLAIYKALIHTPSQANLHIKTDSEWAIKALGENSTRHSDENFTNISHANIIRPTINKMRKWAGATTFEWLKGHSRIKGNEGAD